MTAGWVDEPRAPRGGPDGGRWIARLSRMIGSVRGEDKIAQAAGKWLHKQREIDIAPKDTRLPSTAWHLDEQGHRDVEGLEDTPHEYLYAAGRARGLTHDEAMGVVRQHNPPRPELMRAQTSEGVSQAAEEVAHRITGRHIPIDLGGADPVVAREMAEGILQGLEMVPGARLTSVRGYGAPSSAHPEIPSRRGHLGVTAWDTDSGENHVFLDVSHHAAEYDRMLQLAYGYGVMNVHGPRGVAAHEFGHVVHNGGGRIKTEGNMRSLLADMSPEERAAEAFAEAVISPAGATRASKRILDELRHAHNRRN